MIISKKHYLFLGLLIFLHQNIIADDQIIKEEQETIKIFPVSNKENLNQFIVEIVKAKKETDNSKKTEIIETLVKKTGIPEEFQGAKLEKENWQNITDIDDIIQNALEFLLYTKLEKLDDYLSANFKWNNWLKESIIIPLIEEGKLNFDGAGSTNIDIKTKNNEKNIFDVLIKVNQISPIKKLSIINQKHLKKIPDSISNLKEIEILDISKNNLTELPTTIANLENLTTLNLSNNKKLTNIPKEIIKWDKIEGHSLNTENTKFIELKTKAEKAIQKAEEAIEKTKKIETEITSAENQLNGEEGAKKKFEDGEFTEAIVLANTAKASALEVSNLKQKDTKTTKEIITEEEPEETTEVEKEEITEIVEEETKTEEEPEWQTIIKKLQERATDKKMLRIKNKEKKALIEWAKEKIKELSEEKRTAIENAVRIGVRKKREIAFKKAISETIFAEELIFKQLYLSNQIDILKEATE